MKVMFVIARMQYGGAERVMAELADWFAGMGHQVTLVSGYDFPSVYPLDGRVMTLWSAGHQDGKTRPGRMIGFIRDLCRMMEEDRPDAVVSFLIWNEEQRAADRYTLSYAVQPEIGRVAFAVESVEPAA